MAETTVNLGMQPHNRGNFEDLPVGSYIYKDNIVQFHGSSYIYDPANFDIEHPEASATQSAPYNDSPASLNTGWKVFASGNNQFTTGQKVYEIGIDTQPTPSSNNLTKSGSLFNSIIKNGVFDLTAYSGDTYANLSAALIALNNLPAAYKAGGMSFKFVQSSDNKYVQYRYMGTSTANADFTNVANWQGIDIQPTKDSHNLIESGGVFEYTNIEKSLSRADGTEINGYIDGNTNKWVIAAGTKSYIYHVYAGDVVVILSNTILDAMYCLLSNAENIADGETVNYVSGTTRMVIAKNSIGTIRITSECYLYVLYNITAARWPQSITLWCPLKRYVQENDAKLEDEISQLDDKIDTSTQQLSDEIEDIDNDVNSELYYTNSVADHYLNLYGVEVYDQEWCIQNYRLNTPLQEGDVIVWSGIKNYLAAKLVGYYSNGNICSYLSAYQPTDGKREYVITQNDKFINCVYIRASFLTDAAVKGISINGTKIPQEKFSKIEELTEKAAEVGTIGDNIIEVNSDKKPMLSSLAGIKTGLRTYKKYFVIAQLTDTHGENDLVERASALINSPIYNEIDCLIHTGDIQDNIYSDDISSTEGKITQGFGDIIRNSIKPIMCSLGNHDVYGSTTVASVYNSFMKPMVDKGFLTLGMNIVQDATWYYKDFDSYNIRLIVLNSFDPLYNGYTKPVDTKAYSPSQINFLIDKLSSVPANYTVIVAEHYTGTTYKNPVFVENAWNMPYSFGYQGSVFTDNDDPVLDILNAFGSKQTLNKTYSYSSQDVQTELGDVVVNVDFTNATGIFGFFINGHTHYDYINTFSDFQNIKGVSMVGGIVATNRYSLANILRSNIGKSKDAINVYCVRTDERKVYIIRFGADFRSDGKAQVVTSFTY